jgi:hypothetical protein
MFIASFTSPVGCAAVGVGVSRSHAADPSVKRKGLPGIWWWWVLWRAWRTEREWLPVRWCSRLGGDSSARLPFARQKKRRLKLCTVKNV